MPELSREPVLLLLLLLPVLAILFVLQRPHRRPDSSAITILVLGDFGRSPRMCYHATSAVQLGLHVSIVAYKGSNPPQALTDSKLVTFVHLPKPLVLPPALFIPGLPIKVLFAAWVVLHALLFRVERIGEFILVQNPPAIPTLPLVQLVALFTGSKILIDWHNTGYSVLTLKLGSRSLVVKLAKWIEMTAGRNADAHLCVTEAMRRHLVEVEGIRGNAVVFHDRPPSHFARLISEDAHTLFDRLELFTSPDLATFYTHSPLYVDRPALLVSATSWTADEDFSILLTALASYELAAQECNTSSSSNRLPKVLMVITGKGSGRAEFERQVVRLEKSWEFVRVRTAWLAMADYPRLLGAADLGVSLHDSTSGLDLPMKVVDMFGCGLPVLALEFECIAELVQDGINGRTFRTPSDLCSQLVTLLNGFPAGRGDLERLREGIKLGEYGGEGWSNWEDNWSRVVAPILRRGK